MKISGSSNVEENSNNDKRHLDTAPTIDTYYDEKLIK